MNGGDKASCPEPRTIFHKQQGKLVGRFEGQFHAKTHEDRSGDAVNDADASGAFEPTGGIACAENQQRKPHHGQQTVDAGEHYAHQQGGGACGDELGDGGDVEDAEAASSADTPTAAATPQIIAPVLMPSAVAKAKLRDLEMDDRRTSAVSRPGTSVRSPATNAKERTAAMRVTAQG